jgi:tetratricopeptide (TPR) repeat protein
MSLRRLVLAACFTAGGFGSCPAEASDTYVPPLPPLQNKAVLAGEKLWRSTELLGPGGETCAGCHDSARGPALHPASLSAKRGDLLKLVYFCVLTRSKNNVVKPDGPEVSALVDYLKYRYRLERSKPTADDPKALEVIARAHEMYVAGEYTAAITALNQTLNWTLSPRTAAEAHMLLGGIFDALGDRKRAREEFEQVLGLFPAAQLDRETFPPKTVELFESVRAEARGAVPP